jgi:hypothetical protein
MRIRAWGLAVSVSVMLGGGLVSTASPAFAAPPEAPKVTVESPVNINEATLHGVLNPNAAGEPDEYQFLYKASETDECKGGNATPTPPGMSAGGQHEEPSEVLSKLTPNTEYAVCLRAENLKGESAVSPAVSFKTAEATAPVVVSQAVPAETKSTALVSAQINPGGLATTCEVKYGKTATLEATPVPCPTALSAGDTEQTATAELKGLEPKTEYHVEFVANNGDGTTPATEEATFKTGPYPPPVVLTFEDKEVKRTRATLSGAFLPSNEEETYYYFEYGTEECNKVTETCGVKTPVSGPVTEVTFPEVKVTKLKPGTTYHFWFVASGPGGTTHGEEVTFTTATAEPEEYVFEKTLEAEAPTGLGIDQVNGDLYVANYANGKAIIEQFNAKDKEKSSVAIPENGNDQIYQLAVDNSGISGQQGDVYAADTAGNIVYKFDLNAEGNLELDQVTPKIGEGHLSEPRGVAVDSSGNVYIASTVSGAATVSEFSSTGKLEHENLLTGLNSPSGLAFGLAIDSSGNLYLACAGGAAEYTPTGKCAEPESVTPPERCKLINAGESDDAVTLNSANDIFLSVYEPQATVREYSSSIGHPPIQNPVLEREGTFRKVPRGLIVNNSSHTLYVSENESAVRVFRFLDAKPVIVKTEQASQVSGSIEALNGTVNPGGQEPAAFFFEYGTSSCLAESCGAVATESSQGPLYGDEEIPVSVRLDNLPPNTTFHYRIVGVNEESGVTYGEEQTFTTGGPVPTPPAPTPEGTAPESKTPASSPTYPLLTSIRPVPLPPVPVENKLTRGQRLAKALATCNSKPKKQRAGCKRQARKKYGPVTKGVAKKRRK